MREPCRVALIPLRSVELLARGFDAWVKNSVDTPRLTKRLHLPAFEHDVHRPLLWPPAPS